MQLRVLVAMALGVLLIACIPSVEQASTPFYADARTTHKHITRRIVHDARYKLSGAPRLVCRADKRHNRAGRGRRRAVGPDCGAERPGLHCDS
jgi:hypothetical protein